MKVGLFSDIHLEHRQGIEWDGIIARIIETASGVDLLVNAGDTHHDEGVCSDIEVTLTRELKCKYVSVMGNHDFYGKNFGDRKTILNEPSLYAATMWTNFNDDPLTMWKATRQISDFSMIRGVTAEDMRDNFVSTLRDIERQMPDIVVTHFAPGSGSVHPRYIGDYLNGYFCPDATKTIMNIQPRLWLHGHVHDPCEYLVGETRVISNPLGYPGETYKNISDYSVRIIEV